MIVVTDHSDYNHTENLFMEIPPTAERVKKPKIRPSAGMWIFQIQILQSPAIVGITGIESGSPN
jgi:hypothetical protein